jgi:hypothetical protein
MSFLAPWFYRGALAAILCVSGVTVAAAPVWQQRTGYRLAALSGERGGRTGFTQLPSSASGIGFTNWLSEDRSLTNQILLNGSGIAAGDFDGDGRCDLFFCGLDAPNVLYRNLGDFRFEDVTSRAGVACGDQASTGAAFADVDGDGDLDLLVNGVSRGTRLFLNDGNGRFHEATDEAGLRHENGAASLTLADIDGDGWLDLYVVNYRNDTMRDMPEIRFSVAVTNGVYQLLSVNERPAQAPELIGRYTFDQGRSVLENGQADILFRNLGGGRFARVSWTNGAFLDETGQPARVPFDWGLSAMFRDLNEDGAPDLYVCNDFQSPDRIWINDGHGRFQALPRVAIRQTSLFSMGVDFADVDRDGHLDIFVADMLSRRHELRQVQVMDPMAFAQARSQIDDRPQFSRNTLFRNRGDGTYAEVAQFSGVDASDWSWCPVFLDVDLDGYEDLLITTGHWRDAQHADVARELDEAKRQKHLAPLEELRLRKRFPRLETPNVLYRNRGDWTFEEMGQAWGFASGSISHGMALADLDGDGDLDVVINCLNAAPLLYRNESTRSRVAVRLRGRAPNTQGIGARILVRAPGLPAQSAEIISGGRYLSGDECLRTFATGTATNRLSIEVTWRNGTRSVMKDGPSDHLYEFDESAGTPAAPAERPVAAPAFFEDVSGLLAHVHADEPFDDFARQPLLPRRFSQLGPGISWIDFNGDGHEDLFVGAGRGGRLAVFRNDTKGQFVRQKAKAFETPMDRDLTTVLGWRSAPAELALLMGTSNYEESPGTAPAVRQFSITTGLADDSLLRSASATGPLALGDVDGDGDLDLFVGGRILASRYPEGSRSALLRCEGGRLRFDEAASQALTNAGLVTSATFTDLNEDGKPELVLVSEWGSLRIFQWGQGRLEPWNAPLRWGTPAPVAKPLPATLDQLTGWWNSVVAGDFDGDGRLDLVAGNWGRNTVHQRFLSQPLRIYYGESSARPGIGLALLEAHVDPGLGKPVPARDWATLRDSFPVLQDTFRSFTSFSSAGLPQVLAAGLPAMRELSAATLDSVILLNRGDHFDAATLPMEAQLAPVFGVAVGDLDGDGHEDLFLAQNFFGVSPAESRLDAGSGVWLRGNGQGQFKAVSPRESGIAIYGEGRGVALCDYDQDGRLDLAVGQNRGATKLYRNRGATPGFRLRLQGPPDNPKAIGAAVRAIFGGGKFGPAHEIRAGGGYWSQDSADVILGTPDSVTEIFVRWPGGATERVAVSPGTRSLTHSKRSE